MVIHIPVQVVDTGTYILEGTSFYCTHDDIEVETYWEFPGYFSDVEVEKQGYICATCGEPLAGDPVADMAEMQAEMDAEAQLMEMLDR